MNKTILHILIFSLCFACSNSKKECEEKQINPNGESELALLMRDLHLNTFDFKKDLFLNDYTQEKKLDTEYIKKFEYNYLAIKVAQPTESNLREDGLYNGYADLYINSSKKFLENKTKKNYNHMVSSCIQCHEQFCLGAIGKINKLYFKR